VYVDNRRRTVTVVALLVLSVVVVACGAVSPTPSESPLQTVVSPMERPTSSPTTAATAPPAQHGQQEPTATPDPNRTPVAVVDAEIERDREVITIKNVSDTEQDIGKWTLFNREREPLFIFPDKLVLQPGESVEVYSGVPEDEVPEEGYFWTAEKVWLQFPANVMLLNRRMRLVYWHTQQGGQ